ncbi:MAG: hypothetical protein JWN22_1663 [Nocardioides sp.]|nr:hypothetical protein [Nocardioides sp.]
MAAVALQVLLSACGGGDGPSSPSSASTASGPAPSGSDSGSVPQGPAALPTGKSDLAVQAGSHLSPVGFEPALLLDVPEGWTSVHRGADGFDLGQPDPTRDAPLLAVVVLTPPQASAAAALAAVRKHTTGTVRAVGADIGTIPATGLDITGGTGQLVVSAGQGIALDAAPGQRVRVLAADVGGVPLMVVVLVPDGERWARVLPRAEALLGGVAPA